MTTSGMHRRPFDGRHLDYLVAVNLFFKTIILDNPRIQDQFILLYKHQQLFYIMINIVFYFVVQMTKLRKDNCIHTKGADIPDLVTEFNQVISFSGIYVILLSRAINI